MKTVYADVMIFTNIFEDFLLLYAVKYILRLKTKYYKLVLGSLAGGILSVLSLFNLNFFISILIKIISALLLVLITFGFKSHKLLIKTWSTLIIITFLVNGAIICFYLALKPNGMVIINDSVYFDISPLLLIIFTLIVYIILFLFKKLFKNHSKNNLVKDVVIKCNNISLTIKCKVDSGLNAKEPFSGSSVIVVEKCLFNDKINDCKFRVIPFKSLGGNGIIYGFKPQEIIINNKTIYEEVYIGLYEGKFNNEIKGLLPECILGE